MIVNGGIIVHPGDRSTHKTRICVEVPSDTSGTVPFWTNALKEACTLFELAVRRVRKGGRR